MRLGIPHPLFLGVIAVLLAAVGTYYGITFARGPDAPLPGSNQSSEDEASGNESTGVRPAGPYSVSSESGRYRVTIEQFKRHGSVVLERTPFQLERSTQVMTYMVTDDGEIDEVSMSVSGENSSYLLELEDGQYTITDLTTNEQTEGPKVPSSSRSAPLQSIATENRLTALEKAGMTRVEERTWKGRSVVVYEATGSIVGQLTRPQENGAVGLPVIYDLAPVSQRTGVYVDTETGITIRTYRYAIDAEGTETLIESLEVLSIEKEA